MESSFSQLPITTHLVSHKESVTSIISSCFLDYNRQKHFFFSHEEKLPYLINHSKMLLARVAAAETDKSFGC